MLRRKSEEDKSLIKTISRIIGGKPGSTALYRLAFSHSSINSDKKSAAESTNERLEYLGDSVLDLVVAEYLFKKYPYKDEGFLTEIRSRIVNRQSLNQLAKDTGLSDLVRFNAKGRSAASFKSIYGNALEALIGAVYLDKGFKVCQDFIIKKLIIPYLDIDQIVATDSNFKSRLIEWAQKEAKSVSIKIISEKGYGHQKSFVAQVFLEEKPICTGNGSGKKIAEQAAAEKACSILKITS